MWTQEGNGAWGSLNNALSYEWQNDVKASVYNAWEISLICRMLVLQGFVLDGTQRVEKILKVGS